MKITLQELLEKEVWIISISDYGDFLFIGTEEEAEEMRKDKADWEGGIGKKERTGTLKRMIISDGSGTTSLDNFIERFLTPREGDNK